MPIKLEQLAGSLQRGLAPIYLIGGEEPLLLQECCDQIREAAKAQGFVEREILQADGNSDWSELEQAAAPVIICQPRKLSTCACAPANPARKAPRY